MVKGVSTAMWVIVATVVAAVATVARAQQVPCYFVFGDSVFDNGNNNNLVTKAKVDFSPYGIDFPKGPTGRFSNGRIIPDFIAEYLGFKDLIPPFSGSSPSQAHSGLNYASGGGGIRDETSQHLGGRISLRKQIENHKSAIKKKARVPPQRLNECLYTINIGSNDYINNYFMSSPYNTRNRYTPDTYAYSLVQLYATHLKNLYGLGARKVMVFGLSRIGCIPRLIASLGKGKGCATEINDAAELFNKKLRSLVTDLNKSLAGAKFTFVDMFNGGDASFYAQLGFSVADKGCCTIEPEQELCSGNRPVCPDRTKYVFWDDVHGTEAINGVVAKSVFMGLNTSPYNITQLLK